MDSLSEDDLCWLQLDDFRMLLIKNIEPSRITPYLRQCQVISAEDEEQLFNDPSLVIRRRKVGALLDLLQRTGLKGYTAFLESLELDYPELYKRITGKEPNKKFSILIDTAGESGLTSFLMAELSRLQRALQEERRRRQQACCVAKQQEAWSRQQQLRERELKKLTERVQKLQEERERSSEEVKRLREHNYTLMEQINTLNQDRSDGLLNNRDLQIQVERLKLTVLRAERQTRRLRRHPLRPLQESRSLTLQSGTFQLNQLQEQVEEKQEEENQEQEKLMEKQEEDQKEEKLKELKQQQSRPQRSLLASLFRLRTELHRAEEQRARSVEEKEELELRCAQLKGDAKMYRQQNKQTLRQLEEVIRERDKAMASQVERQEEARQLLQEKDQYREQVRQLTEHSDRLELSLLRSKGEELQLRTRLRRFTCNSSQCDSDEEEQLTEKVLEVSCVEERSTSSEEVHSEEAHSEEAHSEEVHSEEVHDLGSPLGRSSESERRASNAASWDGQADVGLRSRPNFLYRRKRAMRSKVISAEHVACNHDDSSCSDVTVSE